VASLRVRLARKPPGYRFTIGRVRAIYGAIMVALFLAALDQTIVATALPHIVADIGGFESYSWVITAYVLAMAVTVPLYGKLGDIHGRRLLYIIAISIFLFGSVLCGLSQSMNQLVAARAVQGTGAGGLFALAIATVGVIVPPRDRGRYQGLIGATFAAGSIIGPALGGLIVDHTTWRWVFYVNLPVGAAALAVIAIAIPKRTERREHSLDLLGATLLAIGTSTFLLGLVWGGETHPWGSTQVLGAFAIALVSLTAFVFVERRAKEPILPFEFLRNPIVAAGVASVGLSAMAMVGTIAFVPLFVQGVIGTSATSSGIVLTPFVLGAVVASAISGQWISRSGHYRPNALVGPIVLATGLFLLSRMDTSTTNGQAAAYMVVAGVGLGMMMQVFVVAVQNQVPMRAMGSATALTQSARAIGATLGVTFMGVIVNHGLPAGSHLDRGSVHRLPPNLREALANALQPAFLAASLLCLVTFVIVVLWLKQVPLREEVDTPTPEPAAPSVAPQRAR
jgi:EmrB/QacA subfamily drug resistance transporter